MHQLTIYVVGIVLLGLSYPWLKQNVSGILLLAGAIAYLAALVWIARHYGKKH